MAFEYYGSRLYSGKPRIVGEYCVTVHDGKLILALADDNDIFQVWYKDFIDIGRFMLRNKATRKVVKYSGIGDQLELVNKPSAIEDESVLWTHSVVKRNDGYIFIATSSNVELVMHAGEGCPMSGGILVTIYPNVESDNDLWKFIPYSPPNYKLYCKRRGVNGDYCVSVRHEKLVLARPEDNDITQVWYKDSYDDGFMLINKASGKPALHSDVGVQLELVDKPDYVDQYVMWTDSEDVGDGYTFIRTKSDVNLVMDAWQGHISNGTLVSIYPNAGSDNEYWKLVPYSPPVFQLFSEKGRSIDLCVGVRQNKLSLTTSDDRDETQLWYMDNYDIGFVMVHKASGMLVRHFGINDQLVLTNKPELRDASFLWTISRLIGEGPYHPANNVIIKTSESEELVMVTGGGVIMDGTPITIASDSSNCKLWNIEYSVPNVPPCGDAE